MTTSGIEKQERLLRLREVEAQIGLRKSFIYAAMARGEFPAAVRFSRRAVLWPSSAIDSWIAEQIAKASGKV